MVSVVSTNVLYPVALNSHQTLVSAVTAEKGQDYSCIECGQRMIVRQGKIRVEHFAHYTSTVTCNGESALHKAGKAMIKQMIQGGIERGEKILLKPRCKVCGRINKIDDFPIGWDSVELEYSLRLPDRLIRPDIVVFKDNYPSLLIEVVVSHAPEDDAIESLKKYLKQDDTQPLSLLVVPINWHSPLFTEEPCIEGRFELSAYDCPHCKEVAEQKEKERQEQERKEKEKERKDRKYLGWRDLYQICLEKPDQVEIDIIEIITKNFDYKIIAAASLENDRLDLRVYDLRDLLFYGELEHWFNGSLLVDYSDYSRVEVMEWHNNVFDVRKFGSRKELVLSHAYSSSPGDPLEKICRKLLLKEPEPPVSRSIKGVQLSLINV